MNILDPLPETRILSLLLTLQCNAECMHCGTNSSPRVKSRLDAAIARRLIHEAHALDYHLVAFTGGEATLYGPELFDLIKLSSDLGMATRLVTNAVWGTSTTRASEMTQRLKAAGLREINFSTGDQHVRFVKIENIGRATRAALDSGLTTAIMIEVVDGNAISKKTLTSDIRFSSFLSEQDIGAVTICESPWMALDESQLLNYPVGLTCTSENLSLRAGCDSVINTVTILSDGRMMACCGLGTQSIPELEVGHVSSDSLKAVRKRCEDDFLKRWIRAEGPERILAWAATKDSSIDWEGQYAHRCQACKRLYSDPRVRKVLEEKYEEKILDVLASEWLMTSFAPTFGGPLQI
jgi:hypothetical protein